MQYLTCTINHSVATVTLNRPEVRNAFNEGLIAELTHVFAELGADDAVRVVVLAAAGPSFCAGADLNWMRRMADYSYDENLADAGALAQMLHTIATCPKPTITQIQGDVYAGGTGLVAACDMAVAVSSAYFCVSEVKIGLIPATISPYLIRAMGTRAAQRYWLTAERFSAAQAAQMGLVSLVVETAESLQTAVEGLCKQLLAASPDALRLTKQLIAKVADAPLDASTIQHTVEQIAQVRASPSGKAGVQAFLSKTPPPWVQTA